MLEYIKQMKSLVLEWQLLLISKI